MQQSQTVNTDCPECLHKDTIIHRYADLVHLMKKKHMREGQNRSKESIGSVLSVESKMEECMRAEKIVTFIRKIQEKRMREGFRKMLLRAVSLNGPFIGQPAAQNQKQESANSQSTNLASSDAWKARIGEKETQKNQLVSSTRECPSHFLEEQFKFKNRKAENKKIFQLTLKTQELTQKIKTLQTALDENQRRQDKEINKKRISLQGLAEELAEKNDLIEEMKDTIKSLELRLCVKGETMIHRMLEEDGESLKKIIAKLEGVNDKLNHDIAKLKQEKEQLKKLREEELKVNENLKQHIHNMKEQIFIFEHEKQQNKLLKRELDLASLKMTTKIEKLKKAEKKLNQLSKLKDSLSTNSMSESQKKVPIQSTALNLLYKSSEIENIDNKIEHLFTFLFHIEEEDYQLHEPELFDEEEKQLLMTHKERFIRNIKAAQENIVIPVSSKHVEIGDEKSINFGESFLDACEPVHNLASNLKLLELQTENFKLIEKISQLKQKHLHIRCVILQFIKSLDFKNFKKESESILTVLCQYFEYSEQQRNVILQSKSRKYFGFI